MNRIKMFINNIKFTNNNMFSAYKPEINNWDYIFNKHSNIKLEIWNTGQLEVDYDGIINTKRKETKHLKGTKTKIDVPVYYLECDHGSILIDAGLNKNYRNNIFKYVKGFLASKYAIKGKDLKPIVDELKRRKIKLDYLFLTHLHSDHIAGIVDLEVDFPVIIGNKENTINYPLLYCEKYIKGISTFEKIDFKLSKEVYPFKEVVDIFGNGSFFAIKTSGHTKGHISYLVNTINGVYLITGDQVNINKNIETGIGPGHFSHDIDLAQIHFDKIMKFKSLYPDVKLLISHEVNST